jgi:DNA-directed RNA polymerase specialized sigma24 family protein
MINILDILYLKHETWIKYVISFGCPSEIAEDYVQEMYIKIHNYSQKGNDLMFNQNEVNFFFIYVTLKNMYYDDIRSKKKFTFIELEDNQVIEETETVDNYIEQSKAVKIWVKELDKEINREQEYSQYQASLCYIRFIYQKVFIESITVQQLANETNLSYWSIRNTVLRIKQQIKDGSTTKSRNSAEEI